MIENFSRLLGYIADFMILLLCGVFLGCMLSLLILSIVWAVSMIAGCF